MWKTLEKDDITTYLEKLNGSDQEITRAFIYSWSNGKVILHNKKVELTVDLISKVIGIPNIGKKFFKYVKFSKEEVIKFPKGPFGSWEMTGIGFFKIRI